MYAVGPGQHAPAVLAAVVLSQLVHVVRVVAAHLRATTGHQHLDPWLVQRRRR